MKIRVVSLRYDFGAIFQSIFDYISYIRGVNLVDEIRVEQLEAEIVDLQRCTFD